MHAPLPASQLAAILHHQALQYVPELAQLGPATNLKPDLDLAKFKVQQQKKVLSQNTLGFYRTYPDHLKMWIKYGSSSL